MGKTVDTKIIHDGSDPKKHFGSINDPIYKNSTLIFDNYKSFLRSKKKNSMFPITGGLAHILQGDLKN